MKKWLVPFLCGVLTSAIGLSAAASDPREEKEVRATLEALLQAYAAKDIATIDKIYHDDLSYGHATGQLDTKAEAMKAVQRFWLMTPKEIDVRVNGPVAIVRSVIDIRVGATKEKANVFPGMRVLWVFLKGAQGWQVIARQALRVSS